MLRKLLRPRQTWRARQLRRARQVALAQYNTYEARAHLSNLLGRVRRGETIVIARYGEPIARLVPYAGDEGPHRPGVIRAHLVVHDAAGSPP